MSESKYGESDLQIGETVETIFSGNEKFEVYDIRTIYFHRDNSMILEFKLNAIGREELKTSWLYRQQIIPIVHGAEEIK